MTASLFKNDHPKLLWVGVLVITAMLMTACGGGDSSTNVTVLPAASVASAPSPTSPTSPTTTTTVTPTTTPIGEVATLTDAMACPAQSTSIASTTWHAACLVGKRLVGTDSATGQVCELRLKANGVFEYVKNGVIAGTTPPLSQWLDSSGVYTHQYFDGYRFIDGRLNGRVLNAVTGVNEYFGIVVTIQNDTVYPDYADYNQDTAEFVWTDGSKATCKLNNI